MTYFQHKIERIAALRNLVRGFAPVITANGDGSYTIKPSTLPLWDAKNFVESVAAAVREHDAPTVAKAVDMAFENGKAAERCAHAAELAAAYNEGYDTGAEVERTLAQHPVYIVREHNYYHIERVFATRKAADIYVAEQEAHGRVGRFITEWTVD